MRPLNVAAVFVNFLVSVFSFSRVILPVSVEEVSPFLVASFL